MKKMTDLEVLSRLALDFCLELDSTGKNSYELKYIGKFDNPDYDPPFLKIDLPNQNNDNTFKLQIKDEKGYRYVAHKKCNDNLILDAGIENAIFIGVQKKELYIAYVDGLYFEEWWIKNNKKEKGLRMIQSMLVTDRKEIALRENDSLDILYKKEKGKMEYTYIEDNVKVTEHSEMYDYEVDDLIEELLLTRKDSIEDTLDTIKEKLPNLHRIARTNKLFNFVNELIIRNDNIKLNKYTVKTKNKGVKIND